MSLKDAFEMPTMPKPKTGGWKPKKKVKGKKQAMAAAFSKAKKIKGML